MNRKLVFFVLVVTIALLIGATMAIAQGDVLPAALRASTAVGSTFTYQGHLVDGGGPVTGDYDFQFELYDDPGTGIQVGSTVAVDDLTVTDGLFQVDLDFGDVFDGTALWLEIGVRPGAEVGAYDILSPRQALNPTPYAAFAGGAPWAGLDNVPAGLDDGDDDTTYSDGPGLVLVGNSFGLAPSYRLPQSCASGEIARWNGSSWVCTPDLGASFANVIIVAKAGGDFTSVQAALDSISDASDTNPYLVWVAPGVYTESVTMKSYVDIEGAGEMLTKITTSGSDNTVNGVDNAELRDLTVEHTGGASNAIAIYNAGVSPRLTRLTAVASGGTSTNYGVYNASAASPTMTYMSVKVDGTASAKGVYNPSGASPLMTHIDVSATGCTSGFACYGVDSRGSAQPVMNDVTVSVVGNGTSGPVAIFANTDSHLTLVDVNAIVSNGTNSNTGLFLISASATIRDSVITGDNSGGGTGKGISLSGSSGTYTVTVNHSEISGVTATVEGDSAFTVNIGGTLLDGGAVTTGGGTVNCAGVFDEAYAFSAGPACP